MGAGDVGDSATTPTGRQYAYGLGFVAVFLALVVGSPIWLFVTSNTCGCVTPSDLVLYNADARPVTVSWSHPGLFGTPLLGHAETLEVAACTTADVGLTVGHDDVSIESSSATTGIAVDVPEGHGGYDIPILLVHPGGAIERLPAPLSEDRRPGEGACGG